MSAVTGLVSKTGGLLVIVALLFGAPTPGLSQDPYRFPDDVVPPQLVGFPERPSMLLELGDKFYGVGELPYGVSPWTGTYWQPALWVYGNLLAAGQGQTLGGSTQIGTAQVRDRLDLFMNLRLSGTERVFVGFRPLDSGGMTGFDLVRNGETVQGDRFVDDGLSAKPVVYFVEGDIAELFQFLDYEDMRPYDIGFSVGRQNLYFQEGLLVNDIMDVVGLAFNGLSLGGMSNLRISAVWGFGDVNHGGTRDADLAGLFMEADWNGALVDLDIAYVNGGDATGSGLVVGFSTVQQMGFWNTAFRIAASTALDEGAAGSPGTSDGVILFNELSRKDGASDNLIYFNHFFAYDTFSPASTQPPGPLGRIGLLFGGSPLGAYVPALGAPVASNEVGAALGYQVIQRTGRRQFVFEAGARRGLFNGNSSSSLGVGVRVQQAFSNRYVLQSDLFVSHRDADGAHVGGRFGILVKM